MLISITFNNSIRSKMKIKFVLVIFIVFSLILQETEARRKIVRGRKVVNRTYLRHLAIPAWAIVTLVSLGQILIGALMYVIMKLGILDKPLKQRYANVPPEESSRTQLA